MQPFNPLQIELCKVHFRVIFERLHELTDRVRCRRVGGEPHDQYCGQGIFVGKSCQRNPIRLGIQNRRQEIEIAKLFGATDAFIRRPFLYTGLWYGLLGGVLAWAVVSLALQLMSVPINALATLYYSDFLMVTVDGVTTLAVLFIGAGLGLAGSWLAVGRHLHAIEPS